jgi:hypothetical protein
MCSQVFLWKYWRDFGEISLWLFVNINIFPAFQRITPSQKPCLTFPTNSIHYGEKSFAPFLSSKLKGRPLLSVRHYLSNVLSATLRTLRPSSPSTTRGRAMSLWYETRLILKLLATRYSDDQVKKCGTGGACGTCGTEEKCIQHFAG